jgi:hypothetical protein
MHWDLGFMALAGSVPGFVLGRLWERWTQLRNTRAKWTVTRRRARHAWDGWTKDDVDRELRSAKELADELHD